MPVNNAYGAGCCERTLDLFLGPGAGHVADNLAMGRDGRPHRLRLRFDVRRGRLLSMGAAAERRLRGSVRHPGRSRASTAGSRPNLSLVRALDGFGRLVSLSRPDQGAATVSPFDSRPATLRVSIPREIPGGGVRASLEVGLTARTRGLARGCVPPAKTEGSAKTRDRGGAFRTLVVSDEGRRDRRAAHADRGRRIGKGTTR